MLEHERAVEALKDLQQRRVAHPDIPLLKLVDDVARRHDLDAAASEWLLRKALEPAGGDEASACPQCGAALEEAPGLPGHLRCEAGHVVPRRRAGA